MNMTNNPIYNSIMNSNLTYPVNCCCSNSVNTNTNSNDDIAPIIPANLDFFSLIDWSQITGAALNNSQLSEEMQYILCNRKNKTIEEETNKMAFGKFQFGPIKDNSVTLSIRGVAVKNTADEWVCYDEKNDEIVNVDNLTFDCANTIYAMPVALKDIQIGDLIIHNKHYCYVLDGDDNVLNVIDVSDGSIKDIMPTKSPFGFNFVTKVTSFVDCGKPDAENPFGDNFMMFMLMQNEKMDKNNILPFLMMQKDNKIDPLMLALLLK